MRSVSLKPLLRVVLGVAVVLSESVLDQNGPKWSKRPFWSKWPYSELDFSIRETKMVHFGPFWPEEVHFGPFRSANTTLAIPECGAAPMKRTEKNTQRKSA